MVKILIDCFCALIVVVLVIEGYNHYVTSDNTDSATQRSGLVLHTDHGTGCQYLVSMGLFARSITPRLRYDGSQVCSQ